MKILKSEELLAGTSLEKDVTFSAPWEVRAFAMAVRLSESGVCTWDEFRRRLIAEIGRGDKMRAHGWVDHHDGYYVYFLRALETVLREKGIVDSSMLQAKMQVISEAEQDDHDH
jgi:nitrile hydratase accessory protein